MDLQVALERIVQLVSDISFVPFAVGLVVVLTQLIKNFFQLEGTRAALVALTVQVVVWVAYSYFKWRGMDVQFEQWVVAAETIIRTLVSVLFPALLAVGGSQYAYKRLSASKTPGFGKSRGFTLRVPVPEIDGRQP